MIESIDEHFARQVAGWRRVDAGLASWVDPSATVSDLPRLLACFDAQVQSRQLDLAHQRSVSELINEQRKRLGTAVVFVTHDVNPILGMVDRVLYLAGGQFRIGTPDEVLRADVLSELYGTPVDVFRSHGRIVVIGAAPAQCVRAQEESIWSCRGGRRFRIPAG